MATKVVSDEKKALVAAQDIKAEKPPCDHTGYTMIQHNAPAKKGDLPIITGRCMKCGAKAKQLANDGAVVTEWELPPAPPEAPEAA